MTIEDLMATNVRVVIERQIFPENNRFTENDPTDAELLLYGKKTLEFNNAFVNSASFHPDGSMDFLIQTIPTVTSVR